MVNAGDRINRPWVSDHEAREARRVADEWAATATAFLITDDDPTILESLWAKPKVRHDA